MVAQSPKKSSSSKKAPPKKSNSGKGSSSSKSVKNEPKKKGWGCCGKSKKQSGKHGSKKHGASKKKLGDRSRRSASSAKAQRNPSAQPKVHTGVSLVPKVADAAQKSASQKTASTGKKSDEKVPDSKKVLIRKPETSVEREKKVIKKSRKSSGTKQKSDEYARPHTKTEKTDAKSEGDTVMLEDLSIKTFEQDGRLHRTFNYHVSRPLSPKPVEVKPEKKKSSDDVQAKTACEMVPTKEGAENCFVVQQSCTCIHYKMGKDSKLKPLKQVSKTTIKECDQFKDDKCVVSRCPLSTEEMLRKLCETVQQLVDAQEKKN